MQFLQFTLVYTTYAILYRHSRITYILCLAHRLLVCKQCNFMYLYVQDIPTIILGYLHNNYISNQRQHLTDHHCLHVRRRRLRRRRRRRRHTPSTSIELPSIKHTSFDVLTLTLTHYPLGLLTSFCHLAMSQSMPQYPAPRSRSHSNRRFHDWLELMQHYQSEFGHCQVKRDQPGYKRLAEWSHRIRKNRKAGKVPQHHIQSLDDIGFE